MSRRAGVFRLLSLLLLDREREELSRIVSCATDRGLRCTELCKLPIVLDISIMSTAHNLVVSPKEKDAEKDSHCTGTE
jgi:hypothetical protein